MAHVCPTPQPAFECGRIRSTCKRRTFPSRCLPVAVGRHAARAVEQGEVFLLRQHGQELAKRSENCKTHAPAIPIERTEQRHLPHDTGWRHTGRELTMHGLGDDEAEIMCEAVCEQLLPPAHLPGEDGERLDDLSADPQTIRAALLDAFDRQRQVDLAARLVARHLTLGHPPQMVIATLARALLREDAGFHAYQMLEAGIRQFTTWGNTDEGRHVLIAVARYLAAHSPTERAALQTADIAQRLMLGSELHHWVRRRAQRSDFRVENGAGIRHDRQEESDVQRVSRSGHST